jgi:hypothetical protein
MLKYRKINLDKFVVDHVINMIVNHDGLIAGLNNICK